MRLVASPQLSDDDIEALTRAADEPEKVLGEIVARSLEDVSDLLVRERLNALAWLAARGALEVKLAIRLNKDGQLARGIYHEKIGIFSDAASNHVAFAGSSNETEGGLVENFESIKVFWSWEDPQGRVKEEIENFDALWDNKTRGLRVLDFSKTSRELLKRYQQSSPPGSESLVAEDPASYGLPLVPKIPDWVNLREYQEAAIKAWRDAGGQGILGNYYCSETRDEFWVSGVKRRGGDRHWAGGGSIMVDERVLQDYLELRGWSELDPRSFRVVTGIKDTDVSKFHDLENKPL